MPLVVKTYCRLICSGVHIVDEIRDIDPLTFANFRNQLRRKLIVFILELAAQCNGFEVMPFSGCDAGALILSDKIDL